MSDGGVSIIKYETDNGEVQLSPRIVRQFLVSGDESKVTTEEVVLFIKLCQFQRLNPFLREAYLIKYGNQSATMVTGKEVFTKRAFRNPRFDGFEAGITVLIEGQLERREGALLLDGETLIAGWARVYLKNAQVPVFAEASFKEYAGRRADGSFNKTWSSKPATMIRKVALVQALREAFPEDLQGLYDSSEMGQDSDQLPEQPVMVEGKVVAEGDASQAPTPSPSENEGRTEANTKPNDGDSSEHGEMSLDRAKDMRFPAGGGKYPDHPLVEVVKSDLTYCEKYIKSYGAKNPEVTAALRLLVEAWKHYLEATKTDESQQADDAAEVVY